VSKETSYKPRDIKRIGLGKLTFRFDMNHIKTEARQILATLGWSRPITGLGSYRASIILDAWECEEINEAINKAVQKIHKQRARNGLLRAPVEKLSRGKSKLSKVEQAMANGALPEEAVRTIKDAP
jgi:hypothetical protein